MQIKDIVGSGKGGGGHTPTEAPNTLQSDSIISVLEVLSEGEIEGLVNGRQSIYFDGTPLENTDNSKNFDVESDYRYGLPDQAYMSGWPSAESLIDKNLNIKIGVYAIHTSTDTNVDAIKLIVSLPNGISKQESNGDLNGATVNFSVYIADASGVYTHYQGLEITGKTTSAFFRTYRVERPIGSSGIWSVKVVRITPDAENTQIRNDIILAQVVEIKDVKLQFNDTAYIGLKVSAKSVSNKIPVRSYHVKGVKVQIPNNYNPITATYTGQWDGTFVTAWSDNPAWILYDLLTNDRYGCGQWIKPEDIDVYSFYDAGVYNDELVPNGKGGLERRFTFNGILNNQDDAIKTLSMLAGSFNAVLLQEGRLYRVQQDRPSSPVAILTNANVIDGAFVYAGTPHQSRHTVVNVTYQDKTNKYKEQIATVEAAPSELDRYNGVNEINIKAIGAVTESQAMRAGKWHIDTELNQKETCKFAMSFNGFELRVGDIVKIADRNIKTVENSGRILDVVTDTGIKLTLDRPVTYAANDVFSFINSNNQITEFVLTNSNSNALEITLPTGIDLPKIGGAYSFESIVKDRQFKITGYSQYDKHVIEFTAIEHDPNKYARVEQGLDIPASIYSSSIFKRTVNAPTNIKFGVNAYVNDESIRRDLNVSWAQSVNTAVNYYNVSWRVNNGNWTNARAESAYYDITNIGEGVYDVKVTASGLDGTTSTALTGTYTHNLAGGTGSALNPVYDFACRYAFGYQFNDKNLDIQFSNPITNTPDLAVLKDFRLDLKYPGQEYIEHTYYIDRVDAGKHVYYQIPYDDIAFYMSPNARSIEITVYCRDTDNKLSIGTTQTFGNPVPVAPNVSIKPGVKSLMIETNRSIDKDYAGTVIYASQTSGFTPSPTNKIYQGPNTFYIHENITGTWYYRVAHYDTFDAGYLSGLNYSAEASGITATAGGIPTGSTLPVTPIGTEYSYYLDTNTSDKGLYGWDGTKWIKVSNLSDLTNATGKISTTQISDNAITTPKIATNSITSSLIVAGAVTADKLTVNNLAAINANMGNITSGSITLDSTGYIRGGATSYSVGTGIWQGYDSGAYKWRVGTPGSSRAEYNGTAFNIYDASGNLTISSGVVDYSKISGKPTSLSAISSTEANKLSGILDNAGKIIDLGFGTNPGQRDCNDPPSYYPVGKTLQFKSASAVGLSVGGYVTLETNKSYSDNSAGTFTQWAYVHNGGTYKRNGYPTNASWATEWTQDLDRTTYTGDLNATYGANTSNLNIGLGTNLLPNTEWLNNNISPCVMGWNISGCDLWSGASNTPDWVPTGGNALLIYQGARNGNEYNVGADIYITGGYASAATGIPVVAGKRYELSCKLAAHRCTVMITVDFFDVNNAIIGRFSTGFIGAGGGGKKLSDWTQGVCFGIAPANTAYASIYFRKSDTDSGKTNSYAWFSQPHFGLATDTQTVASAYSPGTTYAALTANWSNVSGNGKPQDNATNGATIGSNLYGQITSANASTYIANAAIGSAQIGSVSLVGTNTFSVKTSYSGERIEMNGQVIKVFDSSGVLRVKLGNLSA